MRQNLCSTFSHVGENKENLVINQCGFNRLEEKAIGMAVEKTLFKKA